jgi:lipopolysaccharide/colanic/teichoic acid biosynthesis glycosyltransferase
LSLTRSYLFLKIQKLPKSKAIFFGKDKSLLERIQPNYAPLVFEFCDDIQEVEKKVLNEKIYFVYDEKILNVDNSILIEKIKSLGSLVFSYNQYYEFIYKKVDLENFYYDDFMRQVGNAKESTIHYLFRRFIDIFCGLLVFPFFLISLPFIWIGIYIQDKGKVIFDQDRVGFLGKTIKVYKIRTMTGMDNGGIVNSDLAKNSINKFGLQVTKFGMFLRKTRLDELPQCLNLLNGSVSFIGPRVSAIGVHKDMIENVQNFSLRLLVAQGLTGWAQVHMNIQPKTHGEHAERLAYELYYIKYRSVLLDVSIILKTIKTLISLKASLYMLSKVFIPR